MIIDFQEPMICLQGDIFDTPADHIAFAVNYPNSSGDFGNTGGFAGEVCRRFWPELEFIKFKRGEIRAHTSHGKTFHAMAVHTNEIDGWKDTPELIESCLNRLPVSSEEVIALVLIGGGKAGKRWKANVKNIVGMSRSYKTTVLYIRDSERYQAILAARLAYQGIPLHLVPKTQKYRAQLAS